MIYISSSFIVSNFPTEATGGFTQEDVDWYALFSAGAVTTDAYGNSETLTGSFDASRPRIGFNNLLVAGSVSADYEDIEKPARNISTVHTHEKWQTEAGEEDTEQYIYFNTEEYGGSDYLGLSGHNLGTLGVTYKLQSRGGITNYQDINLGGAVVGGDIAIDAIDGNFQFIISVDGGADELISIAYSSETNLSYTDFIADIDAELTGATASLSGGNLRIESDNAAPTGSVLIKSVSGVNYFATYVNDYVSIDASTGWTDVFTATEAVNDNAIFHQFNPLAGKAWRLVLTPPGSTSTAMFISSLFIGRALILPRGIFVGHTPINYGRQTSLVTNISESGEFLGRVIRNTVLKSSFDMQNIGQIFYRVWVDPFVLHARNKPFFWAWYPSKFPNECAYAWAQGDIVPDNQRSNGMMQFSVNLGAKSP